jgi:hypothetical protein
MTQDKLDERVILGCRFELKRQVVHERCFKPLQTGTIAVHEQGLPPTFRRTYFPKVRRLATRSPAFDAAVLPLHRYLQTQTVCCSGVATSRIGVIAIRHQFARRKPKGNTRRPKSFSRADLRIIATIPEQPTNFADVLKIKHR